jgi:hypothetical protein
MNRLINPKEITPQLNKCFLDYAECPTKNDTIINAFKYNVGETGGIRVQFKVETKEGRYGYAVEKVEIIDEQMFTMWLLRWT